MVRTDTGEPVFLPFRMSCFVLSNLIVTAGMLQPGLGVRLSPFRSLQEHHHPEENADTGKLTTEGGDRAPGPSRGRWSTSR